MPQLSKPQAIVLALYSFGMVIAQTSGQTMVSAAIASLTGAKENSVRQRFREYFYNHEDKRGQKRSEIYVSDCFSSLLKWILSWWPETEMRLAIAMDATSLGQNMVVLAISIVYRGCAIPIAWKILPATQKGTWKPYWLALFDHLQEVVPQDWLVIVLADRGLYAQWLYKAIQKCGWHPFLRINKGGLYHPKDSKEFRPLSSAVQNTGQTWSGRVICFKANPIEATLLARWDEGYQDSWLIITDLPVEEASACWYGLRAWIERGFKHTKSAGWRWNYTRMKDPERATRLWLAISVATLWVLSVGGEADANLQPGSFDTLPEKHIARRTKQKATPTRLVSCFRRGLMAILSALIAQKPLPLGRFLPETWPSDQKTYP